MRATPSINLPQTLPVWPEGRVPRASSDDADLPRLTWYLPSDEFRTGATVLILPGGGYEMVSTPKEGHRPAQWLAAHGTAAAVLEYRHAPQRYPVPLLDAQRALRIVRQQAQQNGLDPASVGCLGFSAGGHLAGLLATQPTLPERLFGDDLDSIPCRPDFFIMIYPVVCLSATCAHTGSRTNLLGPDAPPKQAEELSIEHAVTVTTPPCFIIHGQTDSTVPVENALRLYQALTQHGVAATMHLFEDTGHGFGLGANHPWGTLLIDWLARRTPTKV